MEYESLPQPTNPLVRAYNGLICGGTHLQSVVLLVLRLTWGFQLADSGFGHLTHIPQTIDAFRGWGVPFPTFNVYLSGSMELVGGLLLMFGLATRLISLPLIFNFLVAYVSASRGTLKDLFEGPHVKGYDDFISDSAFPMLMLALIMLAFGPGRASLDHLIKRMLFSSPPGNPGTSRLT